MITSSPFAFHKKSDHFDIGLLNLIELNLILIWTMIRIFASQILRPYASFGMAYASNRKVSQIVSIRDFQDLKVHISKWQGKEIPYHEYREYCMTLSKINYRSQDSKGLKQVLSILIPESDQTITLQELSNLCLILIKSNKAGTWHKQLFEVLMGRIKVELQNTEGLEKAYIITLLKIHEFLQHSRQFELINRITNILLRRIQDFRVYDIIAFLQSYPIIKFPSGLSVKLFNEISKKIDIKRPDMTLSEKVKIYKSINEVREISRVLDRVKRNLQMDIKQNFSSLGQAEIFILLSDRTDQNYFVPMIYKNILEFIEEDGTSSLESDVLLDMILLISSKFKSSNLFYNKKIVLFIKDKIEGNEDKVRKIIQNGFLTKKDLGWLQRSLQKDNIFQTNEFYIWELHQKNIFMDDYSAYISKLNQQPDEAFLEKDQSLVNCLNIHQLRMKFPEDESIKGLMERIYSIIDDVGKNQRNELSKFVKSAKDGRHLRDFHEVFSQRYLKELSSKYEITDESSQAKYHLLSYRNYLFVTGDIYRLLSHLNKYQKEERHRIIDSMLKKIREDPFAHKNKANETVAFISMIDLQNDESFCSLMTDIIIHPLIHMNIGVDSIKLLVNCYEKVMEMASNNNNLKAKLVCNLVNTPSSVIRVNHYFIQFLKKHSEWKTLNKDIIFILKELLSLGEFKGQQVEKLSFADLQNNNFEKYVNYKKNGVPEDLEINHSNLFVIINLKPSEFLSRNFKAIVQTIELNHVPAYIEPFIFNYISCPNIDYKILEALIKNYADNLHKHSQNLRVVEVIKRLDSIRYRISQPVLEKFMRYLVWRMETLCISELSFICSKLSTRSFKMEIHGFLSQIKSDRVRKIRSIPSQRYEKTSFLYNLCMLDAKMFILAFEKNLASLSFDKIRTGLVHQILRVYVLTGKFSQKSEEHLGKLLQRMQQRNEKMHEKEKKVLAHYFPNLKEHLAKIETSPAFQNDRISNLYGAIVEAAESLKMETSKQESCQRKIVKLGEKYVYISKREPRKENMTQIEDIVRIIFDLNKDAKVLVLSQYQILEGLPELKPAEKEFFLYLSSRNSGRKAQKQQHDEEHDEEHEDHDEDHDEAEQEDEHEKVYEKKKNQ